MRESPGWSGIGRFQVLLHVQVMPAPVAVPVSSTSETGVPLIAPNALFQNARGATPANSAGPIVRPLPTKLTLTAPSPGAVALTRSVDCAVKDKLPLVPVTVSVYFPRGVSPV